MLETEPQIVEAYVQTGKLRMVYHHLVNFGEPSQKSAEAAECAGEQGQFWPMHGLLYQQQDALWDSDDLPATLRSIAAALPLDQQAFGACLAEGRYAEKVRADDAAAKAAGIFQRPSFDLNGRRLVGALPFSRFEAEIEALLQGQ